MAYSIGSKDIPVCAMLDARRDQVYVGVYEWVDDAFVASLPDFAAGIDDVFDHLPHPLLCIGDGVWAHRAAIQAYLGKKVYFVGPELGRPNAGAIALLGSVQLKQGHQVDIDTFEPQYLRASQAEKVLEARLAKES